MFDKIPLVQNNPETFTSPAPSLVTSAPRPPEGFMDQFLAFIYTSAHWLGGLIVMLLEQLIPLQSPEKLVDPIGYLALLTLFLMVAEVAKKITWLVVLVGWLLLVARIIIEATR